MDTIDFQIDRINKFLKNHIFEVFTQPTHDENHSVTTNVKVKLTGVKEYYSFGEKKPYVEYTLYILKSNKESDMWSSIYSKVEGKDVRTTTTSKLYGNFRWIMDYKLSELLMVVGIDKPAICTRVINEVEELKFDEDLETPNFESIVREWFEKNPNKHNLNQNSKEKVIQKILSENHGQ